MSAIKISHASFTLALSATLGCTIDLTGTTDQTSANPDTTGPDLTTGGTGTTTDDPPPTSSSTTDEPIPTTGSTSEPTSGTTGDTDTGGEPSWCNGFDPRLTALTVNNNANMEIVDGSPLAAECGGQGSLMIPIYPHFGGFVPDGDSVTFDVVLDVEDFNLGPTGHFFESNGHTHEINCAEEETYGGYYSYSFIPIFPPDAIPDINAIDGKPGVLNVTLHTPQGDVPFTANVILSAMIEECGYGGG